MRRGRIDAATMTTKRAQDALRGLIAGLAGTIRAERHYPTRNVLRNQLIDVPGKFDENDPVMLSFVEPNLIDPAARTPQRLRQKAKSAISEIRKGKGTNKHYPRPEGMSAATQCAFIVSVWLNWDWPSTRAKAVQNFCADVWAAAGGNTKRRGGSKGRTDGFWRDHLREARKWRDTPQARSLADRIAGQ